MKRSTNLKLLFRAKARKLRVVLSTGAVRVPALFEVPELSGPRSEARGNALPRASDRRFGKDVSGFSPGEGGVPVFSPGEKAKIQRL